MFWKESSLLANLTFCSIAVKKPSFKINLRHQNGGNGIRGSKGLTRKALVIP